MADQGLVLKELAEPHVLHERLVSLGLDASRPGSLRKSESQ